MIRTKKKSLDTETLGPVGIVTALMAESRSLSTAGHDPAVVMRISPQALLCVGGVGADRASQAAEKLLASGAAGLLSWGVAGGLDPALTPGTVVLPGSVVDEHDRRYECDPSWHGRLERHLCDKVQLFTGDLLHTREVLASPAAKAGAYKTTGALGVDMESAALAQVAHLAKVPFVAIRAIADPAGQTLPPSAYRAVRADGSTDRTGLFASLARRPQDLFRLINLAFCFRAAHRTLTTVVATAGTGLLFHAR